MFSFDPLLCSIDIKHQTTSTLPPIHLRNLGKRSSKEPIHTLHCNRGYVSNKVCPYLPSDCISVRMSIWQGCIVYNGQKCMSSFNIPSIHSSIRHITFILHHLLDIRRTRAPIWTENAGKTKEKRFVGKQTYNALLNCTMTNHASRIRGREIPLGRKYGQTVDRRTDERVGIILCWPWQLH